MRINMMPIFHSIFNFKFSVIPGSRYSQIIQFQNGFHFHTRLHTVYRFVYTYSPFLCF